MILNQVARRVFTMEGRGHNNKSNHDNRPRSSANNHSSSNVLLLRTTNIFRRSKTASMIEFTNEVENSKDDPKRTTVTTPFLSLNKMDTHDTNDIDATEYDIVSVTSNSTTIDLTPPLVLVPRRVRTSSQSMKRTNIITIPRVPKLLLPFDNNHDENNVDIDDTPSSAILPVHLPVRVRSTTNMNDDDNDNCSDRYLLETAGAFDMEEDVVCSSDDDESNSYNSDCDDSCIFAPPPVPVV